MRAGGASTIVQQSLTPEASSIIKQAINLAHQRGHAQATPLHVATTMLSIPTGLLRAACIQSHSQSHPLRCRALDLCFSVALNRLPSSSQILAGPYRANHQSPSLSNALVAVFKRAQAHQRRGSTVDMQQQQAMIAVRIDVEQLIISILDDPSVSRVMREAGFSSTQVKINVEKAGSLEMATPERNPTAATAVNLDLSLNYDSQLRSKGRNDDEPLLEHQKRNELTALPPWLLQHREERRIAAITGQVFVHVQDQCKWDSILHSGYKLQHRPVEKTLGFSSFSPPFFSPSESQQTHQASLSNPNSTSSTETVEAEYLPKFKELNAENLKILCNSLDKIPCQQELVPEIASTILQCRSGMMRRKERTRSAEIKEETWLLFLGADTESKEKIARGLAAIVFGSHASVISVGHPEFSSSDDIRSKRLRLEASYDYLERFAMAIEDDPHRVFLLEDINLLDYSYQVGILDAIHSGTVRSSNRTGISVADAIIILSCERSDLDLRVCSPPAKRKYDEDERGEICKEETNLSIGFDLNRHADCIDGDWSFDDVDLLEAVDGTLVFECEHEL